MVWRPGDIWITTEWKKLYLYPKSKKPIYGYLNDKSENQFIDDYDNGIDVDEEENNKLQSKL